MLQKPKPIVVVESKSKTVEPSNELLHKPVETPVKKVVPSSTTPVAPPNGKSGYKDPLIMIVPYVLVGAGTASYAALEAIKKADPNAQVLIIGEEVIF
jgi:hypothetical protein